MPRLSHAVTTLLLVAAAAMAGCASVGPNEKPDADSAPRTEAPGEVIVVKESATIGADARADFNEALARLRAGEYEKGIELLEGVVERAPGAVAPKINLAIAYSKLDRLEPAEKMLKSALEVNPTHPVANNEYGMLLRKTGRFAEAKTAYETALGAYPDFQPARKNLGILCDLYLNDPGCALENYHAYSEAVPGDEQVKLWIVDLEKRVGG